MSDLREAYAEHGDFLWGYCYRLTGSAADAEDLVQETFVRAIERPPQDTERPWRPWLVRVATNMRHDQWRKQKVREYKGPWLPSPIETDGAAARRIETGFDAEGRYEMLESVSFAFLLALEALTPQQRAVLLLRDVYDYTVRETADALDLSESNVKTTHHRARAAMEAYDFERRPPSREISEQTRKALERFLQCFIESDAAAMEELLAEDVETVHDAGGEFIAAGVPIEGRKKVMQFYTRIMPDRAEILRTSFTTLNGLPAVLAERPDAPEGLARRWAYLIETDGDGRIRKSWAVLATGKLTALTF